MTARASFTYLKAEYDEAFTTRIGMADVTIPAGNRLPGIPKLSAYAELAWKPIEAVTLAGEVIYRDKLEVHDRNIDRAAPSYTLFNLRLSAEQQQGPWTFGQLLRIDNVFDRKHVGSVIVGDSNGRYYEPGPERSWYAGASASYRF